MDRTSVIITMLAILAIAVVAVLPAEAGVERANGAGQVFLSGMPGGEPDGHRAFAFSAIEHNDGSISGQGQLSRDNGTIVIHFEIDCLRIEGNTATFSGVITQSSLPENVFFDVGSPVASKVVDNGSSGDEISLLFGFSGGPAPTLCESALEGQITSPIQSGQINVQ